MKNILLNLKNIFLYVFVLSSLTVTAQNITTVAGKGGAGYNGDGIPATAAQLFDPGGIIQDPFGNIVFTDTRNGRIRQISPSGILSDVPLGSSPREMDNVIACDSSGSIYFSLAYFSVIARFSYYSGELFVAGSFYAADSIIGEGGDATDVRIHGVGGLVADKFGGFYFSDTRRNLIRYVNNWGVINTVVGDGVAGFAGDGATRVNNPGALALDTAGNLYFADNGNFRIRVLSRAHALRTIAGNGTPGFSGDGSAATSATIRDISSIAIDRSNNLYLADKGNNRVRKVTGGVITTIAGNGRDGYTGDGVPATATNIYSPNGVGFDVSGNIYISESGSHRIRKINTSGIISTFAGMGNPGYSGDGGSATNAQLFSPGSVAVDGSRNIYIVDDTGMHIRKITPSGIISTIAGTGTLGYSGDGGPASAANFGRFTSIAADKFGNLYNCDGANNRIRKISTSGIVTTVAGTGVAGFSGDGGAATAAKLGYPSCVSLDTAGNIYIADFGNARVRKVSTAGIITTVAGNGMLGDSLYSGVATAARIWPMFVTTDIFGNFYVSNTYSIRKVSPSGIITLVTRLTDSIVSGYTSGYGDGRPATSVNINIAAPPICDKYGNIYFGELNNNMIRRIDTSGILNRTYGTGIEGYTGDGYLAASAQFYTAHHLAFDTIGNLYVSESGNNTVRRIQNCAAPVVNNIIGRDSVCIGSSITFSDSTTGGTWSTNAPSVASINSSTGVITTHSLGMALISYTVSNSCGSSTRVKYLTVCSSPSAGIIVAPTNLCVGSIAFIRDSAGTPGGAWTHSSFISATVATMGSGLIASVQGHSIGSDTIIYTVTNICGASSTTKRINYISSPPAGTIIGSPTVCLGGTTTLTDSAGTSGGRWSSSAPGIASINITTGVVMGVSTGSAIITYTVYNSCDYAFTTRAINVITTLSPGTISGTTTFCEATTSTLSSSGASGGTWNSSSIGVATVSSTGVVYGVSGGTAVISYTVSNVCGSSIATTTVTINPLPTPGSVSGASSLCIGATNAYAASGTSGGTWSSSSTSVASVAPTGTVYGVAAGTATISYSVTNGCGTRSSVRSIAVITVPAAASISGTTTFCSGTTTALSASVSGGSWGSASTHATVNSTGIVTGYSAGTAVISYTLTNACGSTPATTTVTINSRPYTSPITGSSVICIGSTYPHSAAVGGGLWSCSDATVLTIDTSGTVMGITAGAATISYIAANTCGADTATQLLNVYNLPDAGVITGIDSVCPGLTVTLTDAAPGGVWSSSDASVANISAAGVVTGVTSGNVVISYTVSNICGSATASYVMRVLPLSSCPSEVGNLEVIGSNLSVYPNPNKGTFIMQLQSPLYQDAQVIIINILGQQVSEFAIKTNREREIIIDAAPGLYFISVTFNGEILKKIIVVE